jgi:hypothetical protein
MRWGHRGLLLTKHTLLAYGGLAYDDGKRGPDEVVDGRRWRASGGSKCLW